MSIVPIRGLFEAHLTVGDLERSIAFYRDVLGLPLAHRVPARQVAFFWVPTSDKAMLGLWSIGTSPLRMRLHIAFDVALPQVFESIVAFGENAAEPHHEPGHRTLEEGDVITMDFGALFGGYHADMTRTVGFGEPASELKKIHDIVRQAQSLLAGTYTTSLQG